MNNITIDGSWLPFLGDMKSLAGTAVAAGLVLAVGAVIIGAVVWVVTHLQGGNARSALWNKVGAALLGAVVLGSLSAAVGWGTDHSLIF